MACEQAYRRDGPDVVEEAHDDLRAGLRARLDPPPEPRRFSGRGSQGIRVLLASRCRERLADVADQLQEWEVGSLPRGPPGDLAAVPRHRIRTR